jgi:hypothetical protein
MIGYEGHRGWINYLAVDPVQQATLLSARTCRLTLGHPACSRISSARASDAVQYLTVAEFYRSLGYTPDDVISFGKRPRSN